MEVEYERRIPCGRRGIMKFDIFSHGMNGPLCRGRQRVARVARSSGRSAWGCGSSRPSGERASVEWGADVHVLLSQLLHADGEIVDVAAGVGEGAGGAVHERRYTVVAGRAGREPGNRP